MGTKITQYRERLDKTLACHDLTNENIIRTNVESRMLQTPEYGTKGGIPTLMEKRTSEVVDFLVMLRSASPNEERNTSPSGLLNAEWKVKQDTEECRVMYKEGPPGTPFHVLLVEGYLDGPVDACLCVAWETTLYKKWWPQFNYPAFKVTSSQCVHEIGISEKICAVRMKVPWPLSPREALLHFYEFEHFQEDLVIVTIKTIDDVERDGCLYGITNDLRPESNNVVRIGLVGGLAIQKVNDQRCYFRFIASLDMKLDFVSPSLINFIARQLIGNGVKLCQKAVASISKGNKDFIEALEGPMYNRIRLANHLPETIKVTETEIFRADEGNITLEDEGNDIERNVQKNVIHTSATNVPLKLLDDKSSDVAKSCTGMYGKKMHIRPEVEHALCTLDRVIEVVRELRMDKANSSSAQQRVLEDVQRQHKPLDTDAYELPASTRDIKSGITSNDATTSMFMASSPKHHHVASLNSYTSEITTRPLLTENTANSVCVVESKVHKGAHECRVENAKFGRHKSSKTSCFPFHWPRGLGHR